MLKLIKNALNAADEIVENIRMRSRMWRKRRRTSWSASQT